MKKILSLLLVCALFASFPAAALGKAKQMNEDVPVWNEATVRQYLLDYIGGKDMSRLYGYYDLQIRRYMPLSAYEGFLSDLEWMTGDFLELGSYHSFTEPENQLKTHVLHLCMEKQDLDLYFTHKDKEDDWEIMAIQFVPADKQSRPSGLDLLVGEDGSEDDAGSAYTETPVTVGKGEIQLSGTLTLPKEAQEGKKVPACVLVHDKAALDQNSTLGSTAFFADLAHALAEMGVASLRYDKRTYTYGETENMTAYEETVEDAIAAGQMLKDNPNVDTARLVVIGHGFGAMLTPRIVSQSEGLFTGMILLGGTPKTYAQTLLDKADLTGMSAEEIKTLRQNVAGLAKMKEKQARELELFGRNGYYFWEMAQYDSVALLKKLKLPALIAQGNSDPLISEEDGWRLYSEQIGDGITFISFKSFRGLNHILTKDLSTDAQGQPTYASASKLDKSAGRSLAQWILSLYQTQEE